MMRTLMPLYSWAQDNATYDARAALLNAGDIAIVTSSSSGPDPYDPALDAQIVELKDRDILVFGYVHVSYGTRPIRDVLRDLTAWRRGYGVTRMFLDEWSTDMVHEVGFMWGAVRGYGGPGTTDHPILAINPGVPMPRLTSVPPGTLVITHEGTTLPNWTPKPWEATLVHSFTDPVAGRAALDRWGWSWGFCSSDGADGNPWDEAADN
jgi:hypothetical protein